MFPNVPSCSQSSAQQGRPAGQGTSDLAPDLFPQLCNLTPLQAQALALRLRGEPVGRIARKLGVTRHTISRWSRQHPAFVAELNRRQQELLADSAIAYRRLLRRSFRVLNSALTPESPDSVRVALSFVHGPASRQILGRDVGPIDEIGVVNQMALAEQLAWDSKEGCVEIEDHQECARRLAQMDFSPSPIPGPRLLKAATRHLKPRASRAIRARKAGKRYPSLPRPHRKSLPVPQSFLRVTADESAT